jgi:DNA polymerase
MLDAACDDHRLRGILQFYGANRSGRWAGRLVQTHNLAKNTLPDLDLARELAVEGDFDTMQTLFGETAFVFSELVRTAFIPSEGCRFVVSDFSAIEARVIAWLAGEQWTLDAFMAGKDIYCETASMMYHVPVVKHGENGELRQKGKVAVLACGYQGGVGAMKAMDKGGTIPEEELQSVVDQWRAANPNIVKLWYDYEAAAKTAIREHRTVRRAVKGRRGVSVDFSHINGNLFIKLPGGRKLCYWGARIREDATTGREQIVYMGVNQTTKQWQETETYGGKLVENVVQATARDCLAVSMMRVSEMGYKIVMHVHDEMIADVPLEDTDALEKINAAMGAPIDWAPGLPLRGDGYETPFYRKD